MRIALLALACLLLTSCRDTLAVLGPGRGTAPSELIAYIGTEGDLYTVAPDGTGTTRLTQLGGPEEQSKRSVHFWPTWSPDGRRIASVHLDVEDDEPAGAGLYLFAPGPAAPKQLFSAEGSLPFFVSWAPDGRALAVLAREDGQVSLRVVGAKGGAADAAVARGNPLYLAWSGDSATLAAHVDGDADSGRVSLLPMPGYDASERDLTLRPTAFRAPAYMADGSLLVGGPGGVLSVPAAGGAPRTVVALDGSPAFVPSPRGDRIAVTRALPMVSGLNDGIDLVDTATGARTRLFDRPIVAFFWSPDGSRLAWIEADVVNREMVWYVGGDAAGIIRVAGFLPSSPFAATLAFFDQYAVTMQLWSPDGRALLFSGWATGGDSDIASQVYTLDVSANAVPRRLAAGQIASWSPRPR